MSPSLFQIGATALVAASGVVAQATNYQIVRTYDSTNFFNNENFRFYQVISDAGYCGIIGLHSAIERLQYWQSL